MVKLKDVVRNVISGANKPLPGLPTAQPTALATEIYAKISCISPRVLGIGGDKQSDFSNQAAELVTDEKFLDELQDKIGTPQVNEDEDEFIHRAKKEMRNLLKSKLK
ncbi:hypothetical protein JHE03_24280 [Pluralibacter gergoviae]|uniref:hypothetical protein n=1 Tax=Pluralibacter gergoviae TaxID=61647 RepID=UPI00190A5039|nr:hypothetical protein [Pluralibacter gergoviae]ELC3073768.1 hypothetical protein [Pluralibacter gergoviae]MBK4119399.1 hypothetical protein [Pluralibacter gergoviae]